MQISSMTGFARQSGSLEEEGFSLSWVWEIKSVNGKNLDIKARLPLWADETQLNLRSTAAACFERGNLSVSLDADVQKTSADVKINRPLLAQVTAAAVELYRAHPDDLARPSAAWSTSRTACPPIPEDFPAVLINLFILLKQKG